MSDWTSGYIADVNYTYGFYREMAPAMLDFVTLSKSQRNLDITSPLDYCELGCGQGFSINLLAAANPHIRFYANDFNPSQIVGAKTLARDAGIGNVHFYDESFADFADAPGVPAQFDIIALHGIYSWISPENREVIVRFIQQKLKVGGLVYVSYNTLPGWAPAMPLRRLFADQASRTPGPLLSKLDTVINFVDSLKTANAKFFLANSGMSDRFDRIKPMNRNYLVHEYFNRHWTPFYSPDVAEELSAAKLTFLASAALLDHVDAVNFTNEQQALLGGILEPMQREMTKDFILNQQFRRDVFVKGASQTTAYSNRELWLNQRFALTTPKADIALAIKGPLGEVTLQEDVYGPLIEIFSTGPKTLKDILADKTILDLGWARLQQAITILIGAGHLEPCLPVKDEARRAKSCRAFNQAVIQRARESADLLFLASPVTGSGIQLSRFPQLYLLAAQEGHKTLTDWVNFVWNILNAQDQRIIKEGTALMTPEENIAELTIQATAFSEKLLPMLKTLQIA